MKRHLASSLFALSLCGLLGGARAADAQGVDAIVPVAIDSVVRVQPVAVVSPTVADAGVAAGDLAPVMRSSSPTIARAVQYPVAVPTRGVAAVQDRGWKMPASRTLMIGGTALALVGLFAVEGDPGAIMALAGGGVAVYGLYLHYNR